ncbi:rhotekin-like, partial [Notothenia coriiceps]|uniref:Rhotekin-like n=1 Tax=Notothenia coriiceps TaxID=8208 RepID=A0A6I9NZW2_9TELE
LQRCAVFCLLQCGTEIHDTDVVIVDRTESSSAVEDFSPGALGPRRLSRLGGLWDAPLGKRSVLRLSLQPFKEEMGPKFNLLAHATLTLEHVQEGFKTHDLSLVATEDDPFWLPLYGSMCCRLVAQPLCMIQPIISGQLKVKLGEDLNCWGNGFSVLRGQNLLCYQSQEDMESEDKPLLEIPITQVGS